MIRTKIICTAGPSIDSEKTLTDLIQKGMVIVRLNCSHGTVAWRNDFLKKVRRVEKRLNTSVGVMLDLQGPKLRVGDLPKPFILSPKEIWRFDIKLLGDASQKIIPTSFKKLPQAVSLNDKIFMDDGLIQTRVVKKNHQSVWVEIEHGGLLESRKGINIPSFRAPLSGLSFKDKTDLKWGLDNKVDFIALSFVRTAKEILTLKKFMGAHNVNPAPLVIAKIEKPEAVANMQEIVEVSDGILVARGDLGIELLPQKVPVVQKMLIEKCRSLRKPVIVATQMLDSMRLHPIPTRAEVSDVASAIYAGADAVLLTGETSSGKYPILACQMMQSIAQEVENHLIQKTFRKSPEDFGINDFKAAFIFNVMQMAEDVSAKAIVMLTRKGNLTQIISKLHPKQPIFSMAQDITAYRKLNLLWGVFPIEVAQKATAKRLHEGVKELLRKRFVKKGERLIFVFRDFQTEALNMKLVEL